MYIIQNWSFLYLCIYKNRSLKILKNLEKIGGMYTDHNFSIYVYTKIGSKNLVFARVSGFSRIMYIHIYNLYTYPLIKCERKYIIYKQV